VTCPGSKRPSPADAVLAEHRHLRLDNTDLSPEEVAARVLDRLRG